MGLNAELARFIVCKMLSIVVRFVYRAGMQSASQQEYGTRNPEHGTQTGDEGVCDGESDEQQVHKFSTNDAE